MPFVLQGGIHVPSFVYSQLLHPSAKGTRYGSLFHVSDWLPTIVSGIVGLDSAAIMAGDLGNEYGFSGEDQWAALQGLAAPPRQEALINIDYMLQDNYTDVAEELDHVFAGLIREIDGVTYKLIRFQEASGRPLAAHPAAKAGLERFLGWLLAAPLLGLSAGGRRLLGSFWVVLAEAIYAVSSLTLSPHCWWQYTQVRILQGGGTHSGRDC